MFNKVTLIGNLGKDPVVKTVKGDKRVGTFSIATSKSRKDREGKWQTQTTWHNIIGWGRWCDTIEKLQKGQLVFIEGMITNRTYQEKPITEILILDCKLLTKIEKKEEKKEEKEDDEFPEDLPF